MSEYKEHSEPVKGHILGYVSELDADKTSLPAKAVIDCLNMDFNADHDSRRPPYDLYVDLSSLLPTNFVILKYHFKTFYDKNGNEKECTIVAAKNTVSGEFKLYIKGYYQPDDGTYDNWYSSTHSRTGWNDEFVELTEKFTGTATYGVYGVGDWGIVSGVTKIEGGRYHEIPTVIFAGSYLSGGHQATGKAIMGAFNGYAQAGGMVDGTTYTEEDPSLDDARIVAFQGIYHHGTDTLEITVAGQYRDSLPVSTAIITNGSTSIKLGAISVENIEITDAGMGYTTAPAVFLAHFLPAVLEGSYTCSISTTGWAANLKFGTTTLTAAQKVDNYFKGWIISNSDTGIIGMVDWSIWNVSDNSVYMVVTFTEYTPPSSATYTFSRFPFIANSVNSLNNIVETNFLDNDSSSVKAMFGYKFDMLWIGMIQDRVYLGKKNTISQGYAPDNQNTDWMDSLNVMSNYTDNAADYQKITIRITRTLLGGFLYHFTLYYTIDTTTAGTEIKRFEWDAAYGIITPIEIVSGFYMQIKAPTDSDVSHIMKYQYTITKEGLTRKWDGIYVSEDDPNIQDKKVFIHVNADGSFSIPLKRELGITITGTKSTAGGGVTPYVSGRAYSLVIELDGTQSIFLKNILCSLTKYVSKAEVTIYPFFNRRITGFLTFFSEFTQIQVVNSNDNVIPDTMQCSGIPEGYKKMGKLSMTSTNTFNWFEDSFYSDIDSHYRSYLNSGNTGLMLQTFLNEYYYSKHLTMARNGINLAGGVVIFGIKKPIEENAQVTSDVSNSESIICFSQMQNKGTYANSIFCTERIKTVARERIIAVTPLAGKDFFVLTHKKVYWKSLPLYSAPALTDEGEYETYGIVNEKGVALATIFENAPIGTLSNDFGEKNFKGIYWIGNNDTYGFMGKEPVAITEDRWRKEFRTLTPAQKEAIVSGYNAEREEIWNYIPAKGKIYIWSIKGKHWKKYFVTDRPQNFVSCTDSRLTWNDNTKIYKMAVDKFLSDGTVDNPVDATNRLDKGSVPIDFFIEKILNHTDSTIWKIPDLYHLLYSIVTNTTSTGSGIGTTYVVQNGRVKVTIKEFKGADINYDLTSPIPNAYKIHSLISNTDLYCLPIKHKIKKRVHTKWYTFRLESESGTVGNIVSFRINGIINSAKVTAGKIIETK